MLGTDPHFSLLENSLTSLIHKSSSFVSSVYVLQEIDPVFLYFQERPGA